MSSRKGPRFDPDLYLARVRDFLASIQVAVTDIRLISNAFVHRSVLNEKTTTYTESNERLEYLGDAVLELIVTENLFYKFPEKPEGELTDLRSAVVRGRNLAEVAEKMGIGDLLLLSRGEMLASGHNNPYLLANAMEALIGALYLSDGLLLARDFINTYIWSTLDTVIEEELHIDPKSSLQAITQAINGQPPEYVIVSEIGAEHERTYTIEARL